MLLKSIPRLGHIIPVETTIMTINLNCSLQLGVNGNRINSHFLRCKSLSIAFLPISLWLGAAAGLIFSQGALYARTMDGFIAYCTSNHDNTGECVNEEDGLKLSCLIVPGQIISCPTPSGSAECVWISSITTNQAQFWCDPSDEAVIYGSMFDESRPEQPQDKIPDYAPDLDVNQDPALINVFENSF